MIINQVPIPNKLNLFGKKPWEIPHLDTLEYGNLVITSIILP
jgi:hypothetical protein